MENKINVAELLKNCPKGMELDCSIWDNVVFDHIDTTSNYPIYIKKMEGELEYLTEDGHFNFDCDAKCVIFPKGKTTWEGFVPPCKFKDGDVVATTNGLFVGIVEVKNNKPVGAYCSIDYAKDFRINNDYVFDRLATEEEKQKLFDAIKANSYKWNAETKTLEKLVEPKFKVGDKIKYKDIILTIIDVQTNNYIVEDEPDNFGILMFSQQDKWELINEPKFKVGDRIKHKEKTRWVCTIARVKDRYYVDGHPMCFTLPFGEQDDWELVPNKFDINTLKPFDKVLVRCSSLEKWHIDFFEVFNGKNKYSFTCLHNNRYNECIPYEGNEHLLGTTDDCNEFYKTW